MTRPSRLVVVTGTGTEVGKTWVTAGLTRALREDGQRVAVRKPAQSFAASDETTDADVLGAAAGEPPDVVCLRHRWYDAPMAPPMAAAALGRPSFGIGDLVGELAWPDGVDVGLVESAGGVRSPLACDGDSTDLVRALDADLALLVADAGLGTINAVRLAHPVLAALAPMVVVLNRYDERNELHVRNREWLAQHDALELVTGLDELVAVVLNR